MRLGGVSQGGARPPDALESRAGTSRGTRFWKEGLISGFQVMRFNDRFLIDIGSVRSRVSQATKNEQRLLPCLSN